MSTKDVARVEKPKSQNVSELMKQELETVKKVRKETASVESVYGVGPDNNVNIHVYKEQEKEKSFFGKHSVLTIGGIVLGVGATGVAIKKTLDKKKAARINSNAPREEIEKDKKEPLRERVKRADKAHRTEITMSFFDTGNREKMTEIVSSELRPVMIDSANNTFHSWFTDTVVSTIILNKDYFSENYLGQNTKLSCDFLVFSTNFEDLLDNSDIFSSRDNIINALETIVGKLHEELDKELETEKIR